MNRDANFYAVDFWQQGNVPNVVRHINAARGQAKWYKLYGTSASGAVSYDYSTYHINYSCFIF